MTEKTKNAAVVVCFMLVIVGFFAAMFIVGDRDVSYTERRKLAQFPKINADAVFSKEFSEELEDYLLDQFPARDTFRKLKAVTAFDLLRRAENNGIYLVGDAVYKLEYPLNETQVKNGAKKLNDLYEKYLSGMNVYYAVIPDKNYYTAEQNGMPAMDYDRLKAILSENVTGMTEIELFDCLEAQDYYRTDPHWRQDRLDKVIERFEQALSIELPSVSEYDKNTFAPFYGAYWGQSALAVEPDEIVYLTNAITDGALLYNYETDTTGGVYTPEKYDGMDAYDIFLRGASSFQTVTNPDNTTGKELVIFRDSFTSSLTPLLLDAYSKITLVDLRYMSSSAIPSLMEFDDQDVLFLYSTLVFNNSAMLR